MFSALRGGGGYQPLDGSDSSDVESQSDSDNRSVDSMDLNGDGVVTREEARQYVEHKLADRLKSVVNNMPNSVSGHMTNVVLGGSLVVASNYIPGIDPNTASKMNIAGMAMLGTSISGLMASGFKWVFGKPLPKDDNLQEIRVDPNRIA